MEDDGHWEQLAKELAGTMQELLDHVRETHHLLPLEVIPFRIWNDMEAGTVKVEILGALNE